MSANFLTLPLSHRQFFTTIRQQIWPIFDPPPPPLKNANVLNGWSLWRFQCLFWGLLLEGNNSHSRRLTLGNLTQLFLVVPAKIHNGTA